MWARVSAVFRVKTCERELVRVTGDVGEAVWSAGRRAESQCGRNICKLFTSLERSQPTISF